MVWYEDGRFIGRLSSVAGGDALASPLQFFPHFFFRLLLHLSSVGPFLRMNPSTEWGLRRVKSQQPNMQVSQFDDKS